MRDGELSVLLGQYTSDALFFFHHILTSLRSEDADRVTDTACSINDWRNGAWKAGVSDEGKQIQRIETDLNEAEKQHGVFIDVSRDGSDTLKRGEETLMINASIMNVSYKPINAPWVIDIDLPKAP